jgi:pilus assembly protein CpaC
MPRGNVVIVPIGTSKRLQMKEKKPIETVLNEKENVAVIAAVPDDPATVNITGREAGMTRITLVARDKTEERYDVVVQLDIEYLQSILQRAVPTASLELIPGPGGTLIIGGTVARTDDIDTIMRTAASVTGAPERIVNAMRVGGVMIVQLDVIIAQVSRSKFRALNLDFLSHGANHSFVSSLGGGASSSSAPSTGGSTLGGGAATFTPPTIGQDANLVLSLFNLGSGNSFFPFLKALRTENVSKLLAEPRLITLSGHSAYFNSGGQQAVPQIAGGGGSGGAAVAGTSFVPFGTQLSFLPIVMGNGKIYLEINPKVDIPVNDPILAAPIPGTTGSTFGRTGQEVRTAVMMEDGQTLVLGGLIQHTVDATISKVPCLGDWPLVGVFFSSKSYTEGESELVIVVTPHLVDAMSCEQVPPCLPGQETRSPDDFELFLEGILEAPRGPREVFPGGHYVPAYRSGGAASACPCPSGHCGAAECDRHGPVVSEADSTPAPVVADVSKPVPTSLPAVPLTAAKPEDAGAESGGAGQ